VDQLEEMTPMKVSTVLLPAILFTTLTLSACAAGMPAIGSVLPTPESSVSEPAGTHAPRMATLGDRIEARPGVFITATAGTQVVTPPTFDGHRGPSVRTVTITVAYENRGTVPLAAMHNSLNIGTVSTHDGAELAISPNGPDESMGPVHPGQTGHLVLTVEPGDGQPAYTGGPIQFTVQTPALLGEPEQGNLGPRAAYYTGPPISK
jgi:hypothetical protein